MKKYFVFIILVFFFVFSSVLLTGCDLNDLYLNIGNNDDVTKYKVTVNYLDGEKTEVKTEVLEKKQGEVVTVKSESTEFGSWLIDGVTVSYDREYKFTVNKDETIYEMPKDDSVKDFSFYVYAYKQNDELKLYCKFYNPSDLEITKVGFLVSNDKNNLNKQIYNWDDINELVLSANEYNEFSVTSNSEVIVYAAFVETRNGENINLCHYSKIYSYGN